MVMAATKEELHDSAYKMSASIVDAVGRLSADVKVQIGRRADEALNNKRSLEVAIAACQQEEMRLSDFILPDEHLRDPVMVEFVENAPWRVRVAIARGRRVKV